MCSGGVSYKGACVMCVFFMGMYEVVVLKGKVEENEIETSEFAISS